MRWQRDLEGVPKRLVDSKWAPEPIDKIWENKCWTCKFTTNRMFGSVTAMAFSQSAGWILEASGSYWSLFAIASSAYLLALVIMHALAPALTPARFPEPEANRT